MKQLTLCLILTLFSSSTLFAQDWDDLTQQVKSTLLKYASSSAIVNIEEDSDETGDILYLITIESDNAYSRLTISSTGKLIEIEEDYIKEDDLEENDDFQYDDMKDDYNEDQDYDLEDEEDNG